MKDKESELINQNFFRPVQSVQDWKEIEDRLSIVHPIRFIIDDYNVKMHMVELKMKLVIVLFIDGKYDIEIWKKEAPEIPEKFYKKKFYYRYDKKSRDVAVKYFGRKKAKTEGIFDKDSYIQYYWTSFLSLRMHLQKTCKEIMVCKADLHRTIGDLFAEYKNV
jgi:hypothetical protein